MRKLKLESLYVASFDTTAVAPRLRGTVAGHNHHGIETYNVEDCGDTQYFDCTFGCTVDTGCCTAETEGPDCVPA